MSVPVFVINLDRSPDRWKIFQRNAAAMGIEVTRISGVDGAAVDRADWTDVDTGAFARNNGRIILPGEYGCHRSHLKALEAVGNGGAPFALIVEDDIMFDRRTAERLQAIIDAMPGFDLIKLVNHRTRWFVPRLRTNAGDVIGRPIHGPMGSSAAYLVSREAAARLRKAVTTMVLPYDIALERYWAIGLNLYSVKDNVFGFAPHQKTSTILQQDGYGRSKFPFWRRIPTALFRLNDYVRRTIGAIGGWVGR